MKQNEMVEKIAKEVRKIVYDRDVSIGYEEWEDLPEGYKEVWRIFALRILRIVAEEMAFWKSHPPDADYEAMITEELWQAIELAREAEDVDKT